MKKQYLLIPTFMFVFHLCTAQECQNGSAIAILDANNVSTMILTGGDFWWDRNEAFYEFPKGSGKHLIFAGGLYIIGADSKGDTKFSGVTYITLTGSDFYPGPIVEDNGSMVLSCENWDKIWSIDKSVVEMHKSDFMQDGLINNPNDDVIGWPGRNNAEFYNIHGFELPPNHELAPFVDLDSDGNYEPFDGDYPAIKGDQNLWYLINDVNGTKLLEFSDPLKMEIGIMAYASSSSDAAIDNTTYYDYRFNYLNDEPLEQFYFGSYLDLDLGCPEDDYIGFDEDFDMVYCYNQDATDGSQGDTCVVTAQVEYSTYGDQIPIVGVVLLDDQPYEAGLSFGVPSGRVFNPADLSLESMINGLWSDGIPWTFGGNGYNPGSLDSVSVFYTDDPADPDGWSMCSSGEQLDDRRAIILSGGYPIEQFDVVTATIAVVAVEDVAHPCPAIDVLRNAVERVKNFDGTLTNLNAIAQQSEVSVFPNPTSEYLIVETDKKIIQTTISTILGKSIQSQINLDDDFKNYNLKDLDSGVYLITFRFEDGTKYSEKLVKH